MNKEEQLKQKIRKAEAAIFRAKDELERENDVNRKTNKEKNK